MRVHANGISLGRVTTVLLCGRGLGYGLALLNAIILARGLGAERFGEFAYAMGLAGLFGLLPHMGISTVVTRTVAMDASQASAILRAAMTAQALLAGAVLILVPLFAACLPAQPVPLLYVALAATQLALGALSWPYLAVVGGHARYDRLAIAELASALSGTLLLLAVALTRPSVVAFLAAQIVAAGCAVVAAKWMARPFLRDAASRACSVKELWRQAAPFGAAAVAQGLYVRLDVLLLGQLASTRALGLYNVAYKPVNLAVSLGHTIAGTLFPVLARPPHGGVPPSYTRGAAILGMTAPALALMLSGLADPVLGLLFGDAFRDAAPILLVLAWAAALSWLCAPLGIALQARGCERAWLGMLVAALLVNAAGNLWAIPRWGALGAAWATVASEVALVLAGLALGRRWLRFPLPLRPALIVAGATGLAWIAQALLRGQGAVVGTMAALLCYGAILYAGRLVRTHDVLTVGGWVREAVLGWGRS